MRRLWAPQRKIAIKLSLGTGFACLAALFSNAQLLAGSRPLPITYQVAAAFVAIVSLLSAVGMARGVSESARSLRDLAARVANDADCSLRAMKTRNDELGDLTDAFNGMLRSLEFRDREFGLQRQNLEETMAARTYALWTRTEQLRLVLDSVDDGIATLDQRGRICAERSRAFDTFFGPDSSGQPYFKHIAGGDQDLALALELDWQQISDGFLPLEVSLGQAQNRIEVAGRQFSLNFKPILDADVVKGALLTVSDVTGELRVRRAEAIQREQLKTFTRVVQDRSGFLSFFRDAKNLVESIRDDRFHSAADKARAVHTLKGNAAQSDVLSVASAAHALEQAMLDGEPHAQATATRALTSAWDAFVTAILPALGGDLGERYDLSRAELDEMERAFRQGRGSDIEQLLAQIQGETTGRHFARLVEQLNGVSQRLGKGKPEIELLGTDIRVPAGRFAPFWTALAHVVNNVADHGLQSTEERALSGKSPNNRVTLSARLAFEAVVIEITDDGRGIAWNQVAERARLRGMPHQTRADLIEAVFSMGFSTVVTCSATSGRGVGMSAVRETCRSLGGDCTIEDVEQGTRLVFTLPLREPGALGP